MEWDPSQFFRPGGRAAPYALLVLNQPINEKAFGVLSDHASYIICADGGANRLYEMMKQHGKESTDLPDRIIGDLDSINPTIKKHYENLNVPIIHDPDQYSTDFTKCLKYLNAHAAEIIKSPRTSTGTGNASLEAKQSDDLKPLEIVILGGLGGRVDQAFSQIHHLYMMTQSQRAIRTQGTAQDPDSELKSKSEAESTASSEGSGGNLYLVSEESITFVLQEGKNTIQTPSTNRPVSPSDGTETRKRKREGEGTAEDTAQEAYLFEENIGIIPLSAPASITTTGFEWDVENWHTEIGGQLSTSNHIRADEVSVETNVPVLFTVELAERLKR